MKKRKTISRRFQVRLAIIVVIALIASTAFLFILNSVINKRNYTRIIKSTLVDVEDDIEETSNINMLSETRKIQVKVQELLDTRPREDVQGMNDALREIANENEFSEMSIVNKANFVIYSSIDEYIGFDMNATEDTKEFALLNKGKEEVIQPVRANAYKGSGEYDEYNKYAGVPLEGTGYLQVAINAQTFQKQIDEKVSYIAANRHIGETGIVIVANEENDIVSYSGDHNTSVTPKRLNALGFKYDKNKLEKAFTGTINGKNYLCVTKFIEGYYLIGAIPESEVQAFRDRAAITNAIILLVVFVIMFFLIRRMINSLIVSKIHNINQSLKKIIEGLLDTKVNEYSTEEFANLSDDINSTVASLKDYMDREQEKVKKELEFAQNIQMGALPKVETLNKYGQLFELYATMDTAKEVGGDFYDFYMLDNSHLAVLIADVSGKGVPAAMFMMTCKTMLKNLVDSGMTLDVAFTRANEELCQSNDADMFVTVWMGIIDLKTGDVEYVNAGHNPPLVYDENKNFKYLECKPGFVLTGMEGLKYKIQKTKLKPGDKLFLYTDGATEANNSKKELFGEERLLEYMNKEKDKSMKDILLGLKENIDAFAEETEQFDDITMVGVRYKGWIS